MNLLLLYFSESERNSAELDVIDRRNQIIASVRSYNRRFSGKLHNIRCVWSFDGFSKILNKHHIEEWHAKSLKSIYSFNIYINSTFFYCKYHMYYVCTIKVQKYVCNVLFLRYCNKLLQYWSFLSFYKISSNSQNVGKQTNLTFPW